MLSLFTSASVSMRNQVTARKRHVESRPTLAGRGSNCMLGTLRLQRVQPLAQRMREARVVRRLLGFAMTRRRRPSAVT